MPDQPRDDELIAAARQEVEKTLHSGPAPTTEGVGSVIDRYELLEPIGEGGMGTVWRAKQSEPVKRQVALKVIKLGMDTKEVVGRFEAERQALAMMDHPHIAKVLDGGATEQGRPYFVMELVQGIPITEYCDQEQVDVTGRLQLFISVCDALQHAHQKGIIHRDVKPSNVLVAFEASDPTPRVIDFGIAKATGAALNEGTVFTQHAQVIGTPEYMAPEQAGVAGLDIDTRADVYSLGVLMYELLTGTKPFDIHEVLEQGYDELIRTIRERTPPKPSTRISSLGSDATAIALKRRMDVSKLRSHLHGDLDTIVMKALEKDRTRRYDTARELALDVERHLNGEAVLAHPPSHLYRTRKFVARNKLAVSAMATILFLLIGGIIGAAYGYLEIRDANIGLNAALGRAKIAETDAKEEADRAKLAEAEKEVQRQKAVDQAERAENAERNALDEAKRARRAEEDAEERAREFKKVSEFELARLGDLDVGGMGSKMKLALLRACPEDHREALLASLDDINFTDYALTTLRENLFDRTVDAIDNQFHSEPRIQAALLQTFSRVAFSLGLYDIALGPQARALTLNEEHSGANDIAALESARYVGAILRALGRYEEAGPVLEDAVERLIAEVGENHATTLDAFNSLATLYSNTSRPEEALELWEASYAGHKTVFGLDHPKTIRIATNLVQAWTSEGRLREADEFLETEVTRALDALGEQSVPTASLLSAQATLRRAQGHSEAALEIAQRVRDFQVSLLGAHHPYSITTQGLVAALLVDLERFDEAESLIEQTLSTARESLGGGTLQVVGLLGNLAKIHQERGELEEAETILRDVVDRERHLDPRDDRVFVRTLNSLASSLLSRRALRNDASHDVEIESLLREALDICDQEFEPEHPTRLRALDNLSVLLTNQGRVQEAEAVVVEGIRLAEETLGNDHQMTHLLRASHAKTVLGRGDPRQAEEIATAAHNGLKSVVGPGHARTLKAARILIEALMAQGAFAKAEPLARDVVHHVGDRREFYADKGTLGTILAYLDRHEEAIAFLRDAIEIAKAHLGPEVLRTALMAHTLGQSLTMLQRHQEAVSVNEYVVQTFETLLGNDQWQTAFARANLAANLESTGHFEQAVPHRVLSLDAARKFKSFPNPAVKPKQVLFDSLLNAGGCLLRAGRSEEAAPILEEALELQEERDPDSWVVSIVAGLLGEALAEQDLYDEAYPLLLAAFEDSPSAPQFAMLRRQALERLIKYLDDWGEVEEANDYREKLKELPNPSGGGSLAPGRQ